MSPSLPHDISPSNGVDSTTLISDHPPSSDECLITRLFDSEYLHMPHPDYLQRLRDRSIYLIARQDNINWILKVHSHYRFRPVTAFLAVNYFDRFLSSHSFPQENGWPFQLLSVACLSLAAKMEEPRVPLLLDLQAFQPKFLFEPKTVQRMELLVMSVLQWRLLAVTPFSYLHFFIFKLPSSPEHDYISRALSASSDLIVRCTRAVDFLDFTPSTIAAGAVLCASDESLDPVFFHERLNKERTGSCQRLMQEYMVVDTRPSIIERDTVPPPASPIGVLDAATCGSCDTRSVNPELPTHLNESPKRSPDV